MAADTVMASVHPGEILLEEFLKPLAVSQYQLAKEIGVPARRINEIVHGQRRISADTALRLARFAAQVGADQRLFPQVTAKCEGLPSLCASLYIFRACYRLMINSRGTFRGPAVTVLI